LVQGPCLLRKCRPHDMARPCCVAYVPHGSLHYCSVWHNLRSPSVWAVSMCWVLLLLRTLCVVRREVPPLWPPRLGDVRKRWPISPHLEHVLGCSSYDSSAPCPSTVNCGVGNVLSQCYRDLTYSIRYFIYLRPHYFYYSHYCSKGGWVRFVWRVLLLPAVGWRYGLV
jgi:hypothetical protein